MAQKSKPIVETDNKGKVIHYWEFAYYAAEELGCNPGMVSMAVHGKLKTVRGHLLRYATQEEIDRFNKIAEEMTLRGLPMPDLATLPDTNIDTIPAKKEESDDLKLSPFDEMLKKKREEKNRFI